MKKINPEQVEVGKQYYLSQTTGVGSCRRQFDLHGECLVVDLPFAIIKTDFKEKIAVDISKAEIYEPGPQNLNRVKNLSMRR